jgi:hypothetical protein
MRGRLVPPGEGGRTISAVFSAVNRKIDILTAASALSREREKRTLSRQ